MRQMGLRAICPRVKTSKKHPEHKIYPYLLGDMKINSPDQVWSTDITYIRLRHGFLYTRSEKELENPRYKRV